MIQLFLYLALGLLIVGNLVVLLIVQQKSSFLEFLIKHHFYFLYHVVLTFFLLPLGEYGRQLREKSFLNFCHDIGQILLREINHHKPELFAGLITAGEREQSSKPFTILEIGIGPGTNFSYYPRKCELIAVDPVFGLFRKDVEQKLKYLPGIHLKAFYEIGAEDITGVVESGTIDAVIGTLVLCSVKDNEAVLREVLRVLKPGAKFYFYEHVKSKPSWKRKIQEFLYWSTIWKYWMCGCDFYDTEMLIRKTGFSEILGKEANLRYTQFSVPLEFIDHNYYGTAVK